MVDWNSAQSLSAQTGTFMAISLQFELPFNAHHPRCFEKVGSCPFGGLLVRVPFRFHLKRLVLSDSFLEQVGVPYFNGF